MDDIRKLREIAEGVGSYAYSDRLQALLLVRMYDVKQRPDAAEGDEAK